MDLGEAIESFEAILLFETFPLEESDINKLTAGRGDKFLIGKAVQDVGCRGRILGQKKGLGRGFLLRQGKPGQQQQYGEREQPTGSHIRKLHHQELRTSVALKQGTRGIPLLIDHMRPNPKCLSVTNETTAS